MMKLNRRHLLGSAAALAASPWFAAEAAAQTEHHFSPIVEPWRTFELTLSVAVDPSEMTGAAGAAAGRTRVWLPVPDIDTDFQRTENHEWSGNADVARLVTDPASQVRMLYAEFAPGVVAPAIQVTTRLQTRSRAVDWSKPRATQEDAALLAFNLQPTDLIPVDGIVRKTALECTRGAHSDLDKTRAIYDWVVARAHREPKVRGCGVGDVRAMLESGDLGGKCADLNAVFVGLCRSVGVPARDLYGVRAAPSAFGYRELGASPANLKGAQHCRAEVFLKQYGWVAMDPADVLKVMRQETPVWIKSPADPLAAPVMKGLFGGWEGNWVAYNTGHDVRLANSKSAAPLPFLMYPQGENEGGRFDELAPDTFRYTITSKEIA